LSSVDVKPVKYLSLRFAVMTHYVAMSHGVITLYCYTMFYKYREHFWY
jgi:hypothetical protein